MRRDAWGPRHLVVSLSALCTAIAITTSGSQFSAHRTRLALAILSLGHLARALRRQDQHSDAEREHAQGQRVAQRAHVGEDLVSRES